MTQIIYKLGDLVLAPNKYGYDSPHYEWCTGLNYPKEYAIIIKIMKMVGFSQQYNVRFINGTEDVMFDDEIEMVAKCKTKISRDKRGFAA